MSKLRVNLYNSLGRLSKRKYISVDNKDQIHSYINEIGLPYQLKKNKANAVPAIVLNPKTPLLKVEFSANTVQIENKTTFSKYISNNKKTKLKIKLRFFSDKSDIDDNIKINIYRVKTRLFLKTLAVITRIAFVILSFFVLINTWTNYIEIKLNVEINDFLSIPITALIGIFIFSKRVYRFFQTSKLFRVINKNVLIESIIDSNLSIKTFENDKDLSLYRRIVQKQKDEVLNNVFISQIENGLTYNYLLPELYIKSPIKVNKSNHNEINTVDDWFERELKENRSYIIIGNPGLGKTINAVKLFKEKADEFLENLSAPIPIFLHANTIDYKNVKNIHEILEIIFSNYYTDTKTLNIKDLPIDDFLFIIDGLDELKDKNDYSKVKALIESPLFSQTWNICTTRKDFFEKYINNSEFIKNYTDVINLAEWNFTKESVNLITNIFEKQGKANEIDNFKKFIKENELGKIIEGPLTLTMLIFIWFNNSEIEIQANKSLLYETFLSSWIKRELNRNNINETFKNERICAAFNPFSM